MISKLVVIFAESELTKYEETSEPYEVSTWEDYKFIRTEEEKSEILKKWKEEEHTSSEMVSGRPYCSREVEQITSVKIVNITEVILKPVKKYFFLYSDNVGVNECSDGFGGTEYRDEIASWSKSKYFDDEESAYFASLNYASATPVMSGTIYVESDAKVIYQKEKN